SRWYSRILRSRVRVLIPSISAVSCRLPPVWIRHCWVACRSRSASVRPGRTQGADSCDGPPRMSAGRSASSITPFRDNTTIPSVDLSVLATRGMADGKSPIPFSEWYRADRVIRFNKRRRSFLQVQPHETGPILFHELVSLLVDLVELLVRLVAFGLVGRLGGQFLRGGVDGLLPGRELLLELLLAHAFRRGNEGNRIPHDQVEFAVPVDVRAPDARRAGGAGEFLFAEDLPVLHGAARFDQPFERRQVRWFALGGTVSGPLHPAVARPA